MESRKYRMYCPVCGSVVLSEDGETCPICGSDEVEDFDPSDLEELDVRNAADMCSLFGEFG